MAIENKTAGADRNKFAWFHARETTQRHKAEAHTAGRFIEYEKKDVNPKISTVEALGWLRTARRRRTSYIGARRSSSLLARHESVGLPDQLFQRVFGFRAAHAAP
jgi:hypothetical protein